MLAEQEVPKVRARYLALRSLVQLESLEPGALLPLAEGSSFVRYDAGTWIAREDEPITQVLIVLEGCVEVRKGSRLITDEARTVGFVSVLGQDPTGVSAYAHTEVLALGIPRDILLDVYESSFPLLRNAIRNAARSTLQALHHLPPTNETADDPEPLDRPLTFVEKIMTIRDTPLFEDAHLDAVADLAAATDEVRFRSGEVIFERGAQSDFSIRIHAGRVRCTSESGESVVVGPAIVLGGLDVAAMLPRSYTAETATEVVGFVTRSEDFFGMLERHPGVGMKLLALFSKRLLNAGGDDQGTRPKGSAPPK